MLEWVSWFVIGCTYNIVICYMYSKLTNNKMMQINNRNILLCLIASVFHCVSLIFSVQLVVILFKIAFTTVLLKLIYSENISKTLITSFLIYLLFAVGEILFVISFIVVLHLNKSFFQDSALGILCVNMIILVITTMLTKVKIICKILSNIVKWCTGNNLIRNIILITIAAITIFACTTYNYNNVKSNELFVLINLFVVGAIAFVIGYFKEQTDNNKLVFEYDNLIKYVKTYEELLDAKNKNQHEYMNQLILIKGMLNKNDKEAIEYIDKALDIEENSEENIWINKFKNIPNGGLKGLLYYKISDIMKNKVNM